ncbi:unnamed protein product, partial [Amoebophrya sp. A25]
VFTTTSRSTKGATPTSPDDLLSTLRDEEESIQKRDEVAAKLEEQDTSTMIKMREEKLRIESAEVVTEH